MPAETKICFKFEGLLADQHLLDGSDAVAFHEAARQYLALHAYFFVHGRVPNGGTVNFTKEYRVYQAAPQQGSVEYYWLVEIAQHVSNGAAEIAGAILFEHFFGDSLRALLSRKPTPPPPLWKHQQILEGHDGNRAPIIDVEAERIEHWRQLQERGTGIAIGWLRPIGRSAETVAVRCVGTATVLFGRNELDRLQDIHWQNRQLQITRAVDQLRSEKASGYRTL